MGSKIHQFPHGALEPFEALPRITPEHAKEVCSLVEQRDDLYQFGAAIIIAVWTNGGAAVKYLIDDGQVTETIRRLKAAEAAIRRLEAAELEARIVIEKVESCNAPSP